MKSTTVENKKARFDYQIIETFETGIELKGLEVKAIREGKMNLAGSFCRIFSHSGKAEVFLVGAHISIPDGDETRSRKLLLHRDEIDKLVGKIREKGLTLIPLKLYFKHGMAKLEIATAKGKKQYDKRETLKKKDLDREAKGQARGKR